MPKMVFRITFDTDEATPNELREALQNSLESALDMPNGDTLYLGVADISVDLADDLGVENDE